VKDVLRKNPQLTEELETRFANGHGEIAGHAGRVGETEELEESE
jgi:ribosomal protein L16/L10AE